MTQHRSAAAALLIGLAAFPILAKAEQLSARARGSDVGLRLSSGIGQSRTTFNFARGIAADASGRVHAVWHTALDGRSEVYYRRSPDGGKTWENARRLSGESGSNEHPSIAVSGDNIFVVWHSLGSPNTASVYLRRSGDGGREWDPIGAVSNSGTAAHASLAAVGDVVHLIWKEPHDGDTEVYYRRSDDAGREFAEQRRLTDAPAVSYVPSVAASDQVVVLAWVDTRDGNEEEYVKVSTDGGITWRPDTRITDNRMNSWAPSVAVDGRTIHLVWFDQKDAPFHLYDAEIKLDEALRLIGLEPESPPEGVHIPDPETIAKMRATQKMQRIQADAPSWIGAGGDSAKLHEIMREFDEMGQPVGLLSDAEKAIDKALALIGATVDTPREGKAVSVEAIQTRLRAKLRRVEQGGPSWVAGGGDPRQIETLMREFHQTVQRAQLRGSYVNKERKLDQALKLMNVSFTPTLPDNLPVRHYGEVLQSRVQAKQQQLMATAPVWIRGGGPRAELEKLIEEFERRMKIASLEWDIYYRRSDDAGETWGDEQRVVDVPGLSHRPHLAARGKELHLVWWDNRDGNDEVYHTYSTDGGRTWGQDVRLTNTPAASQFPMIATAKSGLHLIWTELLDGSGEVYYKRIDD